MILTRHNVYDDKEQENISIHVFTVQNLWITSVRTIVKPVADPGLSVVIIWPFLISGGREGLPRNINGRATTRISKPLTISNQIM